MESDAPYTGQKPEPAATGLSQVRLDVVSMINRLRNQNGVPDLAISQPLMEAAQECADSHYTWHHNREECEAVIRAGYPYGFGSNLTVFTGTAESTIAQKAVDKQWIGASPTVTCSSAIPTRITPTANQIVHDRKVSRYKREAFFHALTSKGACAK